MTITPLPPESLYRRCDPAQFDFASTAEIADNAEIVGQARAVTAIRFGIGMQHKGYNLFLLGPGGTGKQTAARRFLEQKAPTKPTPDDWCYVFNFEQPDRPRALRLPPGKATVLAQEMKALVKELSSALPGVFASEEYATQKRSLEEAFRSPQSDALEQLRAEARQHNIALIQTPGGFAFAPLKEDGEVIGQEDFIRLPPEEQKRIEGEVATLQETLQKIMRQVPQWMREAQGRLRSLNEEVASFAIAPLFDELGREYESLPAVKDYLEKVRQDVVANFENFLGEEKAQTNVLLGLVSAAPRTPLTRYEVNVLVDHSKTQGAPVIVEDQPRYPNLIGRVEHVSQMGALLTDFTLIKPGALHLANGGYLIMDAQQVINQPFSWDALKHALREEQIRIESIGQVYGAISTVSLEPEPIPLDIKIVLIGNRRLYYHLSAFDLDFDQLFKVSADFDDAMPRNEYTILAYARLIAGQVQQSGLRHFDSTGVARVIEHGSRLVGDVEKLTTHIQSIHDLVQEADYWAREEGHELVTAGDVQKALHMQAYRLSRARDLSQEGILREMKQIDTSGEVVGQINGLVIPAWGNFVFGLPARITARVRIGSGGIADIERQVNLGGSTHSKGVLILASFISGRYAAERPFSLSATLVHEQSGANIDGDSASSAELYALLSALSGAPLKQSLAVTGSVDQWGQVQTIGAVNEKIEGFFDLCNARGLTGEQGVLIPQTNVKNLMLRQDVVTAAAEGRFHIYAVSTIDEGITLLTGIPAGEVDENGEYPEDSINGRVVARLIELDETQRSFNNSSKNKDKEATGEPQEAEGEPTSDDDQDNPEPESDGDDPLPDDEPETSPDE